MLKHKPSITTHKLNLLIPNYAVENVINNLAGIQELLVRDKKECYRDYDITAVTTTPSNQLLLLSFTIRFRIISDKKITASSSSVNMSTNGLAIAILQIQRLGLQKCSLGT